jgi:hypothetical protein
MLITSSNPIEHKQKLYVWCASLIRNNTEDTYRIHTLNCMIDSVKEYYPEANIVVSISALHSELKTRNFFSLTHFIQSLIVRTSAHSSTCKLLERKDVKFFVHNHKKLQFEHFRYINKNVQLNPEDYVMFMDDDDMIIRRQEYLNFDVIRGRQIYNSEIFLKNINHKSVVEIMNILKWPTISTNNWEIYGDFSGYISKYRYVNKYFNNISQKKSSCEDLKLMAYLNKYVETIIYTPYIFFRHNPVFSNKEWFIDLIKPKYNNEMIYDILIGTMLGINIWLIHLFLRKR